MTKVTLYGHFREAGIVARFIMGDSFLKQSNGQEILATDAVLLKQNDIFKDEFPPPSLSSTSMACARCLIILLIFSFLVSVLSVIKVALLPNRFGKKMKIFYVKI